MNNSTEALKTQFTTLFKEESGIAHKYLTFKYLSLEQKKGIAEAYAFGKAIQEVIDKKCYGDWEKRRAILSDFFEYENKLVSVLAMMAMMPTTLFRKVLFAYNIDYSSQEAFLRRLEDWQIEAIRQNYNDMCQDILPRALTLKNVPFAKELDWKKVLDELLNFDQRYQNKGAWSKNLMNLDFGFPRYPDGCDSDRQAPAINGLTSLRKFLSVKGDKEGFVVDDQGLYKWLFTKVLSNYLWGEYKRVELGNYVCPGFITTMLAMTIFCIVSPACAMVWAGLFLVKAPLYSFAPFLLAVITPLWCVLALIKFIAQNIGDFAESVFIKIFGLLPDLIQEALGYVGKGLGDFVKYFAEKEYPFFSDEALKKFLSDLAEGFCDFVGKLWRIFVVALNGGIIVLGTHALYPSFGLLCALMMSISLVIVLTKELWPGIESREFEELPRSLKIFLGSNAFLIVFSSFAQPTSFGQWTMLYVASLTVLVAIGLSKCIDYIMSLNLIKQEFIEKFLYLCVDIITGGIILIVFIKIAFSPLSMVLVFSVAALWILSILWIDRKCNREYLKARQFKCWPCFFGIPFYRVRANKYLMSLEVDEAREFMVEVRSFIKELISGSHDPGYLISAIVQHIDRNKLELLKKYKNDGLFDLSDFHEIQCGLMTFIVNNGDDFETALAKARDKKRRREERGKRFSKIKSVIEAVVTLYYLKKAFNRICPRIESKGVNRFE